MTTAAAFRRCVMVILLFVCGLLTVLNSVTWAQGASTAKTPPSKSEWPQFLGPHRNGSSAETGLIESWPASGPKQVWRRAGGVGMSGVVVSGGRAMTLLQTDGQQRLVALNAQTGEPLWQTALAPEYKNGMGNGPRGTPTVSGDRVFVFTGEGILAAMSVSDGKLIWSHNVVEELQGKPAEYGMACSPLVVGTLVVVTANAPSATLAAFDAATGKLAWRAGDDPIGYSSPALFNVGGREQLVAVAGNSVLGLAPESGSVLWRYPFVTDFNCNTANPVAIQGQVFVSSGENHGSTLLKLTPRGDKFEADKVWASLGPKSTLRCEWQTPVLLDGYLYGFDNVGGAGPVTHLTCINAATGERAWQQTRFGKGNLIAADGKLLISTMEGEFVMARATPKAYEEIGRAVVIGPTRQAPALAGGLAYLRDNQDIVCLDVRK